MLKETEMKSHDFFPMDNIKKSTIQNYIEGEKVPGRNIRWIRICRQSLCNAI